MAADHAVSRRPAVRRPSRTIDTPAAAYRPPAGRAVPGCSLACLAGVLLLALAACNPAREPMSTPSAPAIAVSTRPTATMPPPATTAATATPTGPPTDVPVADESTATRATARATARPTAMPATAAAPTVTAAATWASPFAACGGRDGAPDAAVPVNPAPLRILYPAGGQTWLWQEETGTASPLGLLWESRPVVAPDGRRLAFSRAPDSDTLELWLLDVASGQERRLLSLGLADTRARYGAELDSPEVSLGLGWRDDRSLIYQFWPRLRLGGVAREAVFRLDIETGHAQPLLPAGPYAAETFTLSPDGRLVAAMTADHRRVHLLEAVTGRLLGDWPAVGPAWRFAPDGRQLILSQADGAILVNTTDLSQRHLVLPYRAIGVSHVAAPPPDAWLDGATWLVALPDAPDPFAPGATFTLWRVDLATAEAEPVGSYAGFILALEFSPDGHYLAAWAETGEGRRDLRLVETATGTDWLYDRDRFNLLFDHWLPDGAGFVYHHGDRPGSGRGVIQVGHLCRPPAAAAAAINPERPLHWVDARRFLVLADLGQDAATARGRLALHALHGQSVPIGELSVPADGVLDFQYFFAGP